MLDRQPHLAGPIVSLRPLRPDDWAALFAVASDPAIWALHPAHDRWREPVFRRFFAEALEGGGALLAIDTATGAVIGSSRFDHAFAGGMERVIFLVGETNLRSRRALEKIGARLTPRIDHSEMAGEIVRHLVYAIEAAEWPPSTAQQEEPDTC